MNVLAIDPGTKCGWALSSGGQILASGVWNLKGGRYEGGGMRFVRIRNYLNEVHREQPLNRVVFEEVRRHLGTDAAHIYGGIVAVITAFCEENEIPYEGIPVGTVKKFATGKGNANKEAMMEAARRKWPNEILKDDNHADALFILSCFLAVNN